MVSPSDLWLSQKLGSGTLPVQGWILAAFLSLCSMVIRNRLQMATVKDARPEVSMPFQI